MTEPLETITYKGHNISIYPTSEGEFVAFIPMTGRTYPTSTFSNIDDCRKSAKDVVHTYLMALQDASDFMNRGFSGLLSQMREMK